MIILAALAIAALREYLGTRAESRALCDVAQFTPLSLTIQRDYIPAGADRGGIEALGFSASRCCTYTLACPRARGECTTVIPGCIARPRAYIRKHARTRAARRVASRASPVV